MAVTGKARIGGITVHLRTGEADIAAGKLAPRLATLRGARIGILDNHKEFAALLLDGVVEALRREYGVELIRFWRKSYLGIPSPFSKEMAVQCDAVINGVGH